MKFKVNIPEENREFLTCLYKDYLAKYNLSKDEKKALREWVSSGNSPYDNPDLAYGTDFIDEYRFKKETDEAVDDMGEEDALKYRMSCYGYDYDEYFNTTAYQKQLEELRKISQHHNEDDQTYLDIDENDLPF